MKMLSSLSKIASRTAMISAGMVIAAFVPVAAQADAIIYDSLTGGNQTFSEGYTCCQIAELGDQITFAGNERLVTSVTVNLDQFPAAPTPYVVPLTLNLYNSVGGAAGSLIASDTINASITPDASVQDHFNVVFNFNGVAVPNTIFYGLVIPTNTGTPSDGLNFTLWDESAGADGLGPSQGPIPVGTDVSNIVYSRHTLSDPLVDDGPANDLDDGFTPAIQFDAVPEPASLLLFAVALIGLWGFTWLRRRKPSARNYV